MSSDTDPTARMSSQGDNDIRSHDELKTFGYHRRAYVDSYRPSRDAAEDPGSVYPSPVLTQADTVTFAQSSSSHVEVDHEHASTTNSTNPRKRSRDDDNDASDVLAGQIEDLGAKSNKILRRDSGIIQSNQLTPRDQSSAGAGLESHTTANETQPTTNTSNPRPVYGKAKPLTKPKNFPQPLTCYFWANGCCSKSDEDCWYAHYDTGFAAAAPVSLASSSASIAGHGAERVLEITNAQKKAFSEKQEALKKQEEDLKSREEDMQRREERLKRKHFVVNRLYEKTFDIVTDAIVFLETRQNRAYPCELNLRGQLRPVHRHDKPIYDLINKSIGKLANLEQRLDALKQ